MRKDLQEKLEASGYQFGAVVHRVKCWSGKPEDETPLCGADKDAPEVWGYRTVYEEAVTCKKCKGAK